MKVARHHVVELDGCPPERVDDPALVRRALKRLCRDAGLHIVRGVAHRFSPRGLTMLYVLRESHLAYSSWPEHGYAALDLFLCGDASRLAFALESLRDALGARRLRRRVLAVGPRA